MDIQFYVSPYPLEDMIENSGPHLAGAARDLKAWKKRTIQVLKDSPSVERKFLRWKVHKRITHDMREAVEKGELEVGLDLPLLGDA